MKISISFPNKDNYLLFDVSPGEVVEIDKCLYLVSDNKTEEDHFLLSNNKKEEVVGCVSIIDGKYVEFSLYTAVNPVDGEFIVKTSSDYNYGEVCKKCGL